MEFLGSQPVVEKVLELLTLHMGGDVMVAVKAKMRPQGDLAKLVDAINDVEARFKQKFPQTQWIFFEPDVR
jgi:DNA-binding protein